MDTSSVSAPPALRIALERSAPSLRSFYLPNSRRLPSTPNPSPAPQQPQPASQVPGFFRVPVEVREQIYEHVTGRKNVFHIILQQGVPQLYCQHTGTFRNDLTSLSQTCRQIYSEASMVLYGLNTFDFPRLEYFLAFAHKIKPVTLSKIGSITFDLPISFHESPQCIIVDDVSEWHTVITPIFSPIHESTILRTQWAHIWHIIAEMPGLTKVKVKFWGPSRDKHIGEGEQTFLEPLLKGRGLDVFEVEVPWTAPDTRYGDTQTTTKEVPFKLIHAAKRTDTMNGW